MIACKHGNFGIAEILIASSANVHAMNEQGANILHLAVAKGKIGHISELLRLGVDINWTDHQQQTPLHYAAALGDNQMCEYLVKAGARLDPLDSQGRSPLSLAEHKENPHCMSLLQALGASNIKAPTPGVEVQRRLATIAKKATPSSLEELNEVVVEAVEDAREKYSNAQRTREMLRDH